MFEVLALAATTTAAPDLDYLDQLLAGAEARHLAADATWRALLHYEPRPLGGEKSTADAPDFFADPEGRADPQAELRATIAVFFSPPVEESEALQHPQCRFRARYQWLVERLQIDPRRLPPQPCARFEWWRQTIRAEGATLVFAAAYLNNPASMFGHTFLRLDRRAGGAADLLAYTVNFAAIPTSNNPLIYTALGLAGGFPGVYSTLPYYLKVKEYSSLEHRDLWEYRLDLSAPELERLVAHLWELGNVHFDYWYLDENCSYQLLSLLEVARPQLQLTRQFPLYAIPADTIRVVAEVPGLVVERRHRPSAWATLSAQRAQLEDDEVEWARRWAEGGAIGTVAEPQRQARILDAALSLLRFQSGTATTSFSQQQERRLLLARGRLGVPATPLPIDPGQPPEAGHGTALITAGLGWSEPGPFLRLEGRFALHDRLQRPSGYVPGSQIEFLRFGVRVPLTPKAAPAELDQLRVLEIVSLTPLDRWAFRWSWRLGTGLWPQREGGCLGTRCWAYGVGGGPGLAIAPFGDALLSYLFVDGQLAAGPVFRDHYRVGLGGTAGLQLDPDLGWRALVEASYLFPVLGDERRKGPYRLSGALAIDLAADLELRAEGLLGRELKEGKLNLQFTF